MEHPIPPDGPYVAGIDTSLTSSGVTLMGSRMLTTIIGRKGITLLPLLGRTIAVSEQAARIFEAVTLPQHDAPRTYPGLVLVEAPDVSSSHGGLVERVSLTYQTTLLLVDSGVPVGWVPSGVLKGYATGNGGSKDGKVRVREAAIRLWPELGIDKVKPKPAQFDLADSAILAAMALDVLGLGRRVPDEQSEQWLHRPSIQYPSEVLSIHYPSTVVG